VKRPVLHPGRRRGQEEEQPWAGGEKEGSESQAEPGFRSGGWHRHGGRERDTDTEKEKRTEDNVSVGPALPAATRGAAKYPPGLCGVRGGGLLRDQASALYKAPY